MIETIYNDFTTKLLPKIAEGLTITKDYFLDLFGRYAHFLFVRDLMYTILCFVGFIISLIITYVAYKKIKSHVDENEYDSPMYIFLIFLLLPFGFLIAGFITNLTNTIQDAYVPEIRIYQEIKGYMNK